MNNSKKFAALERAKSIIIPAFVALLNILLFSYSETARAGWSVNVGYSGSGTVTLKVTSATGATNVVKTPFMANPSAAINPQPGFASPSTVIGSLPEGASPQTYVQVQATNLYRSSIQSYNGPGDQGDSSDTFQFVIPKSACASSDVNVVPLQITPTSITFHYTAKLSDQGSAVLLRVIDAAGQQRYVVLLTGPSDNTGNNCEGTFTINGDPTQLTLLLDGSTATLPFSIACPNNMVLGCSAPVSDTYNPPAVVTGVTGPFTVTYNPLPSQLVIGITNTVTVTARDTNGCTTMCQFKVFRQGLSFDGFFSPIGGADTTGGTCAVPLRTFKLGNVVPVKFTMSCGGVALTTGLPIITIQKCGGGTVYTGPFHPVSGEWHFNIDSTIIGTGAGFAGNYMITATLPDGSQHTAVIQYKK